MPTLTAFAASEASAEYYPPPMLELEYDGDINVGYSEIAVERSPRMITSNVIEFEHGEDVSWSDGGILFAVFVNGEEVQYIFIDQIDGFITLRLMGIYTDEHDEIMLVILETGEMYNIAPFVENDEDSDGEDLEEIEAASAVAGTMGEVRLITGEVLEIEFNAPIMNAQQARDTFTIYLDDTALVYGTDWEFLSFFGFGRFPWYDDNGTDIGGVVNVRLLDELYVGVPRGRRRQAQPAHYHHRTEHIHGPAAAADITVTAGIQSEQAVWVPFYMERSEGDMSFNWAYASRYAGTHGQPLIESHGPNNFWAAGSSFPSAPGPLGPGPAVVPGARFSYTDEFVARMVGEGLNSFTGYSEYLNLPMVYAGFRAIVVGPRQSVYEAPEFRDLYVHGTTTDTFTRRSIIPSTIPGNLNHSTLEFQRPFIVGTSDDVFSHDSFVDEDGNEIAHNAPNPARPQVNHFHLAEAYFDTFWYLGVLKGSRSYPITPFNDPHDFRFDLHIEEAFAKAQNNNMWQNTRMRDSVKDYYIGGAMIHFEMMQESQYFTRYTGPVNTRWELIEYDYPLFWAISGLHNQWWFWTGVGAGQPANAINNDWRLHTPWFWNNQVDEYMIPATPSAIRGEPYAPLAIESVYVVNHNRLIVNFNREVRTIPAVLQAANWRIIRDDGTYITPTVHGGYTWRSIFLRTNHAINYATALSTGNAANRLDNGVPYGELISGFLQWELDERNIAAGGWIPNNVTAGANAIEYDQLVTLAEAIENGAGTNGTIQVEFLGTGSLGAVRDWSGNELATGTSSRVTAGFRPWMGYTYRSALTGFHIWMDSGTARAGFYYNFSPTERRWVPGFYRFFRTGESQPTMRDIAHGAAHQFDSLFVVNTTVTHDQNSGGASFDTAFAGNPTDFGLANNAAGNNVNFPTNTSPHASLGFGWDSGTLRVAGGFAAEITQGPVTYDRPGQMIIDGLNVGTPGGLMLSSAAIRGHHAGRMNHRNGMGGATVKETLRIEGWGGNRFDSIDMAVIRDFNKLVYRQENLIFHEGGHAVDSALAQFGSFSNQIRNDHTAAWATELAPATGMRFYTVDGDRSYVGIRSEIISTGVSYWGGAMREGFQGINDGVWTPLSNREELWRYAPYVFEALRRTHFNGDLNLWYNNNVGNPAYRVIPEDWELLRDTVPAFSHWTCENYLISWGLTIPILATHNPYTSQGHQLARWPSFGNPSIWDIEPFAQPTHSDWRQHVRYDWGTGQGTPYHAPPGWPNVLTVPQRGQEHPFFTGNGVSKPHRPDELQALVNPVSGTIDQNNVNVNPRSPILVDFILENHDGTEVTMNNAMTSFDLFVDGQLTHFYFWTFEEIGPGSALVTLRLEWPIDADDFDKVTVVSRAPAAIAVDLEFVSIWETGRNTRQWRITFWATEIFGNGHANRFMTEFIVPSQHANVNGEYTFGEGHPLEGRTIVFDIRNNGSNIVDFRIRDFD